MIRRVAGSVGGDAALRLDKAGSTVEWAIRKLREMGRVRRVGPATGEHWEVVE